ncbi:8-amino-7-oxononanoate synthase [Agarivorans aestuarii]|uniref:8-amino-7-ketopelargonate synthase n=1 Tax=Agarivorans aestuarii TaxID=1563703 RepID=A0ABU7FZ80_9ALTE|nr:8-amino-7-oxononanoate synthase [Agarivorans aestuarii]MEE1672359.1 8-amino-7-oxononanoate synthase [Agarivorans aestuarii]
MAFEFVKEQVEQRKQQQLFRQRRCQSSAQGRLIEIDKQGFVNFSSNDYLGLSHHAKVIEAWKNGAERYGVGSGGSPLVTGFQQAHYELEETLCDWQGREGALLFNSGFSANQSVIKALLSKNDLLIQDKLNHASLMEAGVLCNAHFTRFKHNSMPQLAKKLASQNSDNCLVITEGVFSMDGDQAPLRSISDLCKRHKAWLMVDDAHGVGCLGYHGAGSLNHQGLSSDDVQIQMITFGKALGVSGAAILCSQELKDYLINFDKSYVYSTAMPAAQACAISEAIKVLQTEPELQQNLESNIALFKHLAKESGVALTDSNTAIQPIIVGEAEKALLMAQSLQNMGFWVSAIRPPTVPVNTARLRVTISSHHQEQDIVGLIKAISELNKDNYDHR